VMSVQLLDASNLKSEFFSPIWLGIENQREYALF